MPMEILDIENTNLSVETIKKTILPHYNLGNAEVTPIKFKDTDKQRAVYKISTSNNSFCLKKVYFDKGNLLFVYSAIEWLYRCGINVPRILPTNANGRFVDKDGILFILTNWVEGDRCSYDNISHIMDSASNLGKMHKCAANFKPIPNSTLRTGFDSISTSTAKHFNQILQCSNSAFKYKDKFSKLFLQSFDVNSKLSELSLKISTSINENNLSKSLCHLDYVNKNIIFDTNNNICVIDFDKCKIDYCAHDISYFLRRILKRDNTKWTLELTINSLNQYELIRPLTLDDYKYIAAYLAFPQKFWKISRDYYNNINKCNKTSFQTLLKHSVSKSDSQLEFSLAFIDYIENKFKTPVI